VFDYLSKINQALRETLISGVKTFPKGLATKRYLLPSGVRTKRCVEPWIESALNAALIVNQKSLPLDSDLGRKVVGTLNLKHVFSYDKVQAHHLEKFNDGVSGGVIKTLDIGDIICDKSFSIQVTSSMLRASMKPVHHPSIFSMRGSEKKSPVLVPSKEKQYISSSRSDSADSRDLTPLFAWLASFDDKERTTLLPYLKSVSHYECNLGSSYVKNKVHRIFNSKDLPVAYRSVRGKISHLMESGGKDRAIVQPFFCFQVFFEPLKSILKNISLQDPNIFTFTQDKGIEKAQALLSNNNTLYCFDASSFTDRFPLSFQLDVLRTLKLHDWSLALKSFMTGVFVDKDQKRLISYNQGQPMGLGPSFHLATVSHSTLIRSLYTVYYGTDCNSVLSERGYGVVGDDVFIADKTVADAYTNIMSHWDVNINATKSVISKIYGEFCGRLFDSTSCTVPFKPKSFRWEYNKISTAIEYYGKSYIKLLSKSNLHTYTFKNTLYSKGGGVKKLSLNTHVNLVNREIKQLLKSVSDFSVNSNLPNYQTLFDFIKKVHLLNKRKKFYPSGERRLYPSYVIGRGHPNGHGVNADRYSTIQRIVEDISLLIEHSDNADIIEGILQGITCQEELEFIMDEILNISNGLKDLSLFLDVYVQKIDVDRVTEEERFKSAVRQAKLLESLEHRSVELNPVKYNLVTESASLKLPDQNKVVVPLRRDNPSLTKGR
jgi:hypothetical protein